MQVAGFAIGGTETNIYAVNNTGTWSHAFGTAAFQSLRALIEQALSQMGQEGFSPEQIVVATTSHNDRSDISLAAIKWPRFTLDNLALHGIGVKLVSTSEATAAGLAGLEAAEYITLAGGEARAIHNPMTVIDISRGIGVATRLPNGSIIPSRAGYSTCPAANFTVWRAAQYLATTGKRSQHAITVEDLIGGESGFSNLSRYHRHTSHSPTDYIQRIAGAEERGNAIGPLITSGAMDGDAFCKGIMWLYGTILGTFCYNLAVTTLPEGGEFCFTGGVMQARGVARYIIEQTPFKEFFFNDQAPGSRIRKDMPLRLVTAPDLTARGAAELAQTAF